MRQHTVQGPVRALGLAVALSSMVLVGCHDETSPTTPLTSPIIPQGPEAPPTAPLVPALGVELYPQELRLSQGESGVFQITVRRYGGYTGAVDLGVGATPDGVLAMIEPSAINGWIMEFRPSVVTITASATSPVGTYPLIVTGSGTNVKTDTTTGSLTIVPATGTLQPNIEVWSENEDGDIYTVAGDRSPWMVTVKRGGGFTGDVRFSVEGLPSGATATFDPPSVAAGYTRTILWLQGSVQGASRMTIRAQGDGVADATVSYGCIIAPAWR